MNIAETITHLRTAKKALKEATERVNMCHRTINGILSKVPHDLDHISNDFHAFCNNSLHVINEDFEDIRDPDEVMEDIEEAVNLAGNEKRLDFDSQDEFNQEALARCNAYLAVRDRWVLEVCHAVETQPSKFLREEGEVATVWGKV